MINSEQQLIIAEEPQVPINYCLKMIQSAGSGTVSRESEQVLKQAINNYARKVSIIARTRCSSMGRKTLTKTDMEYAVQQVEEAYARGQA